MTRATAVVALALAVIAGTAAVVAAAAVSIDPATEIRPGDTDADAQQQIPGNRSPSRVPSDHVPRPAGNALASSNPGLGVNVAGLNFEDHRAADGGNQFSIEPPDQALCVGNGFVFEAVNNVFRVYSTSGAPVSDVAAWNPFFTQDHQFDRTTLVVGEDLFDPKCYFDPGKRWSLLLRGGPHRTPTRGRPSTSRSAGPGSRRRTGATGSSMSSR